MSVLSNALSWFRSILARVFPDSVSSTQYDDMDDAIKDWLDLYYDTPNWAKEVHNNTLNLPAAISSEFARLIMVAFEVNITGSERADFLQQQFKRLSKKLRVNLEECCALGGILFKPYVSQGRILTDCLTQERFIPIQYTDDEITAVACLTKVVKGKYHYFRIEKQVFDSASHTHTVTSKYYVSTDPSSIGKEITPEEYPDKIVQDYTIRNTDRPLFAFFRIPLANKIEKDSPLGVSVFSSAIKKIEQADRQWDRFLWEFEGGELAVDADERSLRPKRQQGQQEGDDKDRIVHMEMPKTRERLFRRFRVQTSSEEPFYHVFSPTLRDSSYGAGLDKILKQIEFDVGLAYGTISDPQNVDKTAEEVKSSKHRSFAVVDNMQKDLQAVLEDYIYALDQYASACSLAPAGEYDVQWNWGDGVLEDTEKETQIRLQEVNSGIVKKEEYLMWRYGLTEDKAKEKVPQSTGFSDYFSGGGN